MISKNAIHYFLNINEVPTINISINISTREVVLSCSAKIEQERALEHCLCQGALVITLLLTDGDDEPHTAGEGELVLGHVLRDPRPHDLSTEML